MWIQLLYCIQITIYFLFAWIQIRKSGDRLYGDISLQFDQIWQNLKVFGQIFGWLFFNLENFCMPTLAFNATWQIFIVVNGQRLNNNQYRHLVTLLHSILNVGSPLHSTSLTRMIVKYVPSMHLFSLIAPQQPKKETMMTKMETTIRMMAAVE